MNELTGTAFLSDWQAAESAAVEHMKTFGFVDAQLTSPGADGGVDVLSTEAAAQVKFYASPVGRPDIQRLRGAAHEYRLAIFYATSGYTAEAVAYANQAGVALFQMDPLGRCEAASDVALLLVEPELVQERRYRLEELQAVRYRYAAAGFEVDLELYVQFSRVVPLDPEESIMFSSVLAAFEPAISEFRQAIESKDFGRADVAFWGIEQRRSFLAWTTGATLTDLHDDLEQAIAAGWRQDAELSSDHLLQRIAAGVVELQKVLYDALAEWEEHFPAGVRMSHLVDDATRRFAGMLQTASIDPAILSAERMTELKSSIATGVQRGLSVAEQVFGNIVGLVTKAGLDPRELIAARLRAQSIVDRIGQQLTASGT